MERKIIEHYCGQLVRLNYHHYGKENEITGIIRCVGVTMIIFDVNDTGKEIPIPNIDIEKIKFV